MPEKIILRVDGNSEIGLGHLYRGMALLDILKDHYSCSFLIRKNTTISPLKNAKISFQYIPDEIELEDEPEWICASLQEFDTIVLDGYQFREEYQTKIKLYGKRLVYVDDLARDVQKADVVINHSPNIKKEDYNKEDYTQLALGLEYAILRKTFINCIKEKREVNRTIKNVFILFGGSDPDDFTFQAARNIVKLESINSVTIVLGAAYIHSEIFKIKNDKLNIYRNQSEEEVFDLMNQSDVAIAPASTTSLELASIGVPIILGFFVENQKKIYSGFVKNNAIFPIGNLNTFDFSRLNGIIKSIDSKAILQQKSKALKHMFIGHDKKRILNLFQNKVISIRNVEESDMNFVFSLSNELEVRRNSFNSDPILLEDHKKWFADILKSKNLYYIIEFNENPVGQIRFKYQEKFSVIGISVSNKYRGKGLATISLKQAVKEYFKKNSKPILAYIKKTNTASINVFKRVDFLHYKEDFIDGEHSVVYIRRK